MYSLPLLFVKNFRIALLIVAFFICLYPSQTQASVPTVSGINTFQMYPDDTTNAINWCNDLYTNSTTTSPVEMTDSNGYKYWDYIETSASDEEDFRTDHSPMCLSQSVNYQQNQAIPDSSQGDFRINFIIGGGGDDSISDLFNRLSYNDFYWHDATGLVSKCDSVSYSESGAFMSLAGVTYMVATIKCPLEQISTETNGQGGFLEQISDLGNSYGFDLYYFSYTQNSDGFVSNISNTAELNTFLTNLKNSLWSGNQNTPAYIGDETRVVDLVSPAYRSYEDTTFNLSFMYYQSDQSLRADYFKVDYTSTLNGNVYTEYGNLDNSQSGELISSSTHSLPESQYTCSISLYADHAVFAFGIEYDDYLIDTWYAGSDCLFNVGNVYPFPKPRGWNDEINADTSTTTNTDFVDRINSFFQEILKKHPFAWGYDSLSLLKQAIMYEQDYAELEVTMNFVPMITNATSSSYFHFNNYATKTNGLGALKINFIKSSCSYLVFEDIEMCPTFRTIIAYFLYLALIIFYLKLLIKFFASRNSNDT